MSRLIAVLDSDGAQPVHSLSVHTSIVAGAFEPARSIAKELVVFLQRPGGQSQFSA